MTLEKQIEAAVCKYAREKGFEAYKFSSPARVGVPDRMFMAPFMRLFFIEFKRPGERPTKIQKYWLERLNWLGFRAVVVRSLAEFDRVLTPSTDPV